MQKRYGDKTMKQLERLDRKTKQFSVPELKKVIEGLKTKLNELNGWLVHMGEVVDLSYFDYYRYGDSYCISCLIWYN